MSTFFIKRNDTSPAFQATLKDASDTAVDLTGATLRFHMVTPSGTTVVDAAATAVTATAGICKYVWATGDTASAGDFSAEFEVTYADSTVETFPNYGYETVRIYEDLL